MFPRSILDATIIDACLETLEMHGKDFKGANLLLDELILHFQNQKIITQCTSQNN
jgi:hypothetical protein